jgi:hypothetical protein
MKNSIAGFICALGLAISARAATTPDLTGSVIDSELKPVKNATVFIYTAGPKIGTGSVCPSCYPDCRKKAQTSADGSFKIESLDPKLIFRLLVVAAGKQPKFVTKVDPDAGPKEIELNSIEDEPGRVATRGIIINPQGQPVFGAVLSVEGVEHGRSTRWGGIERDADPVSVSDEDGLFTLRCSSSVNAVHALLETGGYAKKWVRLTPGGDHILRIQNGVTVRGQVLDGKGKPIANGVVAMATVEREAGKHMHDFEAITGEDGKFAILNVSPEQQYSLFGKMESFGKAGALNVRQVKAGATDTTVDLGTVTLGAGHTLKGRVILPEGDTIPPHTRLFLGREDAWDHTETVLGPNGEFEFDGVPAESVTMSLRIRGYKLSRKNPSLDWLNGSIMGRVEKDLTDFNIIFERGDWQFNREEEAPPGTVTYPRDVPLRAAKL